MTGKWVVRLMIITAPISYVFDVELFHAIARFF